MALVKSAGDIVTNILYLNPAGYIGGAERSLLDLVKNLPRQNFSSVVVLLGAGPLAGELREMGIECVEMELPGSLGRLSRGKGKNSFGDLLATPFLLLPLVRRLFRLVSDRDIKIIHTNGIKAHLIGCALSALTGKILIWHFRDLPADGIQARWFRVLARLFPQKIIANSHKVKDGLGNLEKVSVVYNGVNLKLFPPSAGEDREEWGVFPGELLAGTVGHFAPLKGYEDFVKSIPYVLKEIPQAKFIIVGEALYPAYRDCRRRIEDLIRNLKLEKKVILPGYRDDLPRILAALDIFVLPSWSEGFGRANLEAMAAGKPVVSTRVGGIPEVVLDGESGILVPPHDPKRLAEAIVRLGRDGQLREKMGQTGRKRAEHFSVEKMVAGVVSVYDEVLSKLY